MMEVKSTSTSCNSRVKELQARNGKQVLLRVQTGWSPPILFSLIREEGPEYVLIQLKKNPITNLKYCESVLKIHKGITGLRAPVKAAATAVFFWVCSYSSKHTATSLSDCTHPGGQGRGGVSGKEVHLCHNSYFLVQSGTVTEYPLEA